MSTNNKVQYFTIQGLEDLKRELKELKDKKIPDIANLIDEAKQQGDLSENAEYHQAKEDMAWAQGRLQEINYLLDNAEVVDSAQKNQNIVIVGSAITVKTNAFTKSYTIVGPQESSPLQGKISNESPLGASFLGHKVGDEVMVNTPAGAQTYKILEIK
ncbi:MAG: transcription elongation factor GreA [Candidatus Magasanikbacteria bacterium GW2011_GWA2_40_10]|uniref:Transcription elongation factor GreA n=1 Tax=Candidatus Magasanikbacteria bacterium GW2011_GWA2_40_10 TaxID=1619037 RepID=A0A0G0SJ86_9BACT|nr:MAG: transcription elongation factor GreA [Candidatus Magasanikbacteria bacterium GW2011_GWA2_40_10]